ncbi:MAG: glutathione S-transferase family protein [Steroidobacteraceae bacterium]|jgi:glutathione S-transferase
MYELYVANKNYSSWSLRPWVLMRAIGIEFKEHSIPFGGAAWKDFLKLSPSGKIPCLVDGSILVWDSLAITEYLAEGHRGVWPQEVAARAWARSAAAEMHSGFTELRNRCSMSCGVRLRLKHTPAALTRDIARLDTLWNDGLHRFGGPFLAASSFTAVDAFFAPVAYRVQTYGLGLSPAAAGYAGRLLEIPAMREWYAAALAENFRDAPHEEEMLEMASLIEDLRAPAR